MPFPELRWSQIAAEVGEVPMRPGQIVAGDVNMHDGMVSRGGPFQHGHGPGDRADVVAVASQRLLRLDYAVAPVPCKRLFAPFQDRWPEGTSRVVRALAARGQNGSRTSVWLCSRQVGTSRV